MGRIELGALVSRALAVWVVFSVLENVPDFAKSLGEPSLNNRFVLAIVIKFALFLGVSALLWFKAGSFGTWVGPESPVAEAPNTLSKPVVATAILQGVAAYWIVLSTVGLATSSAFNAPPTSDFAELFRRNSYHTWGTLALMALAVVLLFKAKDVARSL